MKRVQALIAAGIVTVLLTLGLVAVGVNAAFNANSVPPSDSPTATAKASNTAAVVDASQAQAQAAELQQALQQINQLKALIAQYQTQDKQYQQQIDQANTQVQQLQSILIQLQRAGVIQVQGDGSIVVGRQRGGDGFGRGSFGGNSFNG